MRGLTPARLVFLILLVAMVPRPALADRAEDLIRIHVEAIGGRDRIEALKAMRAAGYVFAGGKRMRFTMIAARPDRVRVETELGGRTLVQVSDGRTHPWEFDTGEWPPKYRDMAPAAVKTFQADAEFDDPLVAGAARGFTFDFAGETAADGKKMLRILVTRRLTESFSLLLDPDTFLIVRKIEERKDAFGTRVFAATQFADYRPVNGVLIPHQVALVVDGQLKQRTQIDSIQGNPEFSEETFVRPAASGARKK